MVAAAIYAGEGWTDQPPCVPPVLRMLCIEFNDLLRTDKEREEIIGPYLFHPIGRDDSEKAERERVFLGIDYAVRVFAPIILRVEGENKRWVSFMEELPPITDEVGGLAAWAKIDEALFILPSPSLDSRYMLGRIQSMLCDVQFPKRYSIRLFSHRDAHRKCVEKFLELILKCCEIGESKPLDPKRLEKAQELVEAWA